jgi:single-strand DNA-binding protein
MDAKGGSMGNVNKVMLMGNMTRDPALKFLPSGTAVCEFGMAINRVWYDQQTKEKKEAVTFVDCRAWGKTGENISKYFKKGSPIFVDGRLDYQTWEAKDGSGKRHKLDVVVEGFEFCGGRSERGGEGGGFEQRPRTGARPAPAGSVSEDSGGGGQGGGAQGYDDEVPF